MTHMSRIVIYYSPRGKQNHTMISATMTNKSGSSMRYILAHKWTNNNLELQVKWTLGDITWEPIDSCKKLKALDTYLELRRVTHPQDLPQCVQDN